VICGSAFKNKGVQPLLDAVVDFLPSPLDVRRSPGIDPNKKVDPEHPEANLIQRPASDDAPFSALAFKIMTDPFVGQLAFFRVYSGVLSAGSAVYNSTKQRTERIGRLLKMHANKREEIKEVYAGDIAASGRPEECLDRRHHVRREAPHRARGHGLPKPVLSLAIEPQDPSPTQEKLGVGLQKLRAEDPTFTCRLTCRPVRSSSPAWASCTSRIIVDRLKREFSVEATVGKPQVAYKENAHPSGRPAR